MAHTTTPYSESVVSPTATQNIYDTWVKQQMMIGSLGAMIYPATPPAPPVGALPRASNDYNAEELLSRRLTAAGKKVSGGKLEHCQCIRKNSTITVIAIISGQVVTFEEDAAMFPNDEFITRLMLALD